MTKNAIMALSQLKRYMKVYGSTRGFAVAPRLTVGLPRSVQFVQLTYDEKVQ